MPRARARRHAMNAAQGACRRLAAWLGVVALLLQLLVPLAQPQAAWVEDGLFPPTCSVHDDLGGAEQSVLPECGQCALCHSQAADRAGVEVERAVSAAFDRVAEAVAFHPAYGPAPVGAQARPPLPSRGPPAA